MIQQLSEDLRWSQIVARAWCDDDFMKRLRSEPRDVLTEHGLEVDEGTEVQIVEGTEVKVVDLTDSTRHFMLTAAPPDELTDEDLLGGAIAWCGCASAACARCVACAACGRCGRCGCRCW
jgi:hypothetical protein